MKGIVSIFLYEYINMHFISLTEQVAVLSHQNLHMIVQ